MSTKNSALEAVRQEVETADRIYVAHPGRSTLAALGAAKARLALMEGTEPGGDS